MILVCIHGAPGVGKLSVGRELERISGYILVHDHLVIETAAVVFPFGEGRFSCLRSRLYGDLLDAACTTRSGIILTHANDIFWEPSFETLLLNCVKLHGYQVKRFFLECDEAEHAHRISSPARAEYRKIRDIVRLDRLVEAGEFNKPILNTDDIIIDTTAFSPAEVAGRIACSLALNTELNRRVG